MKVQLKYGAKRQGFQLKDSQTIILEDGQNLYETSKIGLQMLELHRGYLVDVNTDKVLLVEAPIANAEVELELDFTTTVEADTGIDMVSVEELLVDTDEEETLDAAIETIIEEVEVRKAIVEVKPITDFTGPKCKVELKAFVLETLGTTLDDKQSLKLMHSDYVKLVKEINN